MNTQAIYKIIDAANVSPLNLISIGFIIFFLFLVTGSFILYSYETDNLSRKQTNVTLTILAILLLSSISGLITYEIKQSKLNHKLAERLNPNITTTYTYTDQKITLTTELITYTFPKKEFQKQMAEAINNPTTHEHEILLKYYNKNKNTKITDNGDTVTITHKYAPLTIDAKKFHQLTEKIFSKNEILPDPSHQELPSVMVQQ